jgi:tRNA 2-thiouridine synthesizing protein A
MKPGETLELIARDSGAPTDLPAWCRMTGNTLVSANHPVYVILKKTG